MDKLNKLKFKFSGYFGLLVSIIYSIVFDVFLLGAMAFRNPYITLLSCLLLTGFTVYLVKFDLVNNKIELKWWHYLLITLGVFGLLCLIFYLCEYFIMNRNVGLGLVFMPSFIILLAWVITNIVLVALKKKDNEVLYVSVIAVVLSFLSLGCGMSFWLTKDTKTNDVEIDNKAKNIVTIIEDNIKENIAGGAEAFDDLKYIEYSEDFKLIVGYSDKSSGYGEIIADFSGQDSVFNVKANDINEALEMINEKNSLPAYQVVNHFKVEKQITIDLKPYFDEEIYTSSQFMYQDRNGKIMITGCVNNNTHTQDHNSYSYKLEYQKDGLIRQNPLQGLAKSLNI